MATAAEAATNKAVDTAAASVVAMVEVEDINSKADTAEAVRAAGVRAAGEVEATVVVREADMAVSNTSSLLPRDDLD